MTPSKTTEGTACASKGASIYAKVKERLILIAPWRAVHNKGSRNGFGFQAVSGQKQKYKKITATWVWLKIRQEPVFGATAMCCTVQEFHHPRRVF